MNRSHLDNDPQFMELKKAFVGMSIDYITSVAHSLILIGLAEHMNRMLMDEAEAIPKEAGMYEGPCDEVSL